MKRYSTVIIILHWILAPALLIALYMGDDIATLSNQLDLKVDRLIVHMIAGIIIGLAFILRLLLKLKSPKIANDAVHSFQATLANWGHLTLYLLVFCVVISGIGIAIQVDMLHIVTAGETMPLTLSTLPIRSIHGILTDLLMYMIFIHIIAALFHQFVLKDGLFSRIGFKGK